MKIKQWGHTPVYEAHYINGAVKRMTFWSRGDRRGLDIENGRNLLAIFCHNIAPIPDMPQSGYIGLGTMIDGFIEYRGRRWRDPFFSAGGARL